MTNLLEGKAIKLRALEPEDLEVLYAWENDPETWKVSETLAPISRYILKKYLENAHKDIFETRQLRLIIELESSKKALGCIDLFDFDPFHKRAGIGVLISGAENRHKGYATEALSILIAYCRSVLKLHQLYCNIEESNETSFKLFKNAGFKSCGIKKDWLWTGTGFTAEHQLQLIL